MLLPGLWLPSAPGGMSDAMSVRPSSVSSCACMMPSAPSPSVPYSPKVLTVSSPPSTFW